MFRRSALVVGMVVAFGMLTWGTIGVFRAFDANSHSASDTLRPFLITVLPVWAVAAAGAWALWRRTPGMGPDQ